MKKLKIWLIGTLLIKLISNTVDAAGLGGDSSGQAVLTADVRPAGSEVESFKGMSYLQIVRRLNGYDQPKGADATELDRISENATDSINSHQNLTRSQKTLGADLDNKKNVIR